MSKKKHNIAYIKPNEPKFLRELKAQAGYKEGPNVDTKRQNLPDIDDDDLPERPEEEPTVVVLKEGDLTADEADEFQKQQLAEEAKAPADLSKRIIFNKKSKAPDPTSDESPVAKRNKKSKATKAILSFNEDEDD